MTTSSAQAAPATTVEVPEATIVLEAGEQYAGLVLDTETGQPLHHLILLATRPDKRLAWQAAKDWAASVGGELPTRQEQALLYANCKRHLNPARYWSSEQYEHDASYAWYCGFGGGTQDINDVGFEACAVAVRRLTA